MARERRKCRQTHRATGIGWSALLDEETARPFISTSLLYRVEQKGGVLQIAERGVGHHTHINREAEFMVYIKIDLVTLGRSCLPRGAVFQHQMPR